MALDVTFLGHAGFLLSDGKHTLAIDPFLTGNPVATHDPDQITCDAIALTHGHADHFGDTLSIAKRNGATVFGAFEIVGYLNEQGHEKCEPGNPGGRIETDWGWVAFTQAFHSSSYEGRYMGMPCGVVARMGGKTFYHCGDTALFSDLKLIGELYKPDVAAIPVGDRFTMGPEHGAIAADYIGAPTVIPIHYGTWPLLAQGVDAFKPKAATVKVMQAGDSLTF